MAKRILMSCEEFNGDALLEMGYLTQLVQQSALSDASGKLAAHLASLAPLSVQAMKELCNAAATGSFDSDRAEALVKQCKESDDLAEGMRARAEKRPAVFRGR
jgi:enoyl-CoA hydratase/carnithine racemase